MQFYDTVVIDGVRRTRDGYLVASAKTARTGIQTYTGREIDPDNAHGLRDRAQVRVYRSPDEVFNKDALASMAHRPVTVDHPAESVTAKNWKKYSGGITGDEVLRDGDFVRVPLTLMDQGAIDAFEAGKRELSWGYSCDIAFGDGVSPEGEAFDAEQKNIRANHLATCSAARGGPDLRIEDQQERIEGGHEMALKTIIVDGLPVETTDAGEAAITKLRGVADAATKALETAQADHAKVIATKDADLAKKDAEIDDLKGQVLDAGALDTLVAQRAGLISTAKAIAADVKTDGLSDADIRKAVVVAKLGDAAVKDKPAAYIDARFDILAEAAGKTDQVRDTLLNPTQMADADTVVADARAEYLASLTGDKQAA